MVWASLDVINHGAFRKHGSLVFIRRKTCASFDRIRDPLLVIIEKALIAWRQRYNRRPSCACLVIVVAETRSIADKDRRHLKT
jgi:hypothetical protein